ncbi:hypothetical protein BHM03_00045514, partial [Ensete ventricosum]
DRYANRSLPGGTAKISRQWLILAVGDRFRLSAVYCGYRRSIVAVGGRLREKSTVIDQLKKKKEEEEEERKKEEEDEKKYLALSSPARRPCALAARGSPMSRRCPRRPRATFVPTPGDVSSPRARREIEATTMNCAISQEFAVFFIQGHAKSSSIENLVSTRPEHDQKHKEKSVPDAKSGNPKNYRSSHSIDFGVSDKTETGKEHLSDNNMETVVLEMEKGNGGQSNNMVEVQLKENNIETSNPSVDEDAANPDMNNQLETSSSPLLVDKQIEGVNNDHSADADSNANLLNEDSFLTTDREKLDSEKVVKEVKENISNAAENERQTPETSPSVNKQQEQLSDSHVKVQEQLDEVHNDTIHYTIGTLIMKNLPSLGFKTGQSKEARLARICVSLRLLIASYDLEQVCAGLSSRLQEYKAENKQLEELLVAEVNELTSSYEASIKQLQQDLSASKMEVARVESNMSDALAAKNSEIDALVNSLDALKKEAAASEEKLASLQALREELASAEHRAEEERTAHNATKMAAVEREVELEHRAVESSNALARIQRAADESTSRAAELEHKLALLEVTQTFSENVEYASLNQELQDLEARNRHASRDGWNEKGCRALLTTAYIMQEHMELEKRYRELTDLLLEAERSRITSRASSSWEEDTDIKALE